MDTSIFSSLLEHYHWQYSLIAMAGILIVSRVGERLLAMLIPVFGEAAAMNNEAAEKKMQREIYAKNQKWNRKWGLIFWAIIFGFILPFCLTIELQPWWSVLVDIFVILMVYDFFYYLVHRFLFHDGGFMGGPLIWVHAVHHQQHNPCRLDSSYIHP